MSSEEGKVYRLGHWEVMILNRALAKVEEAGRLKKVFAGPGTFQVIWTPDEVEPECERCGGREHLFPLVDDSLVCARCLGEATQELKR